MARRKLTDDGPSNSILCPECWDKKHQLKRHIHWLKIGGETELAGHLNQAFVDEKGSPEAITRDHAYVQGVIAWVNSINHEYDNMADEETGQKMPVWKAWLASHHGKKLKRLEPETEQGTTWRTLQNDLPAFPNG
jgi:hypothetical protein